MKKILIFGISFLCLQSIYSQKTLTGKVVDIESGDPLIGVTILIIGTEKGTIADFDGKFSLEISLQNAVIQCSYIGYKTQEINIEEAQDIIIKMEPSYNIIACPIIIVHPIDFSEPSSISKITNISLNNSNQTSIRPALNRETGIYMHSGALNTNRITIRGIGNRSPFATTKIRSYLDDIPLTSGIGETTIEDIDLSIIDQVDIWKGPTASKFGAGLGGMIHLKTKNKIGHLPTALSSSFTVGSYGLLRNVNNFNYRSKDSKFNLNLNYNLTHSDGYRDNNEYDRQGFTALAQWNGEKSFLTGLFNFIDLKAFIPSSLNADDFQNDPSAAAFTWRSVRGFEDYKKGLAGFSYEYRFNYQFKNITSLFYTYRDSYESRPFNILTENSQALGLRTRFVYQNLNANLQPVISIGGEFFNESYDWKTFVTNDGVQGDLLSENEEERQYANYFAEAKLVLADKLFLETGFNLNATNYDYTDLFQASGIDKSGDYSFDLLFSPRLGLSYFLKHNVNIYATVSHGFSPPTLEETLTPDGAINPDIQPEKGWNFELGTKGVNLNGLSYKAAFYSMQIKDLLVAKRVAEDQFIGINAGKTQHNGIEMSLIYEIPSIENMSLTASYTYSDYQFKDFIDEEADYSGNKLTGTAPHIFNAGIDYSNKIGIYAHLNYQFVDAMPMRDDNSIFSESFQVMNFKIGYQKDLGEKWNLNIYGGINNLWDAHYASMILINAGSFGGNAPRYYYPGLPRNYYGGVVLKYLF